jgi:hypothetical protein
MGWMADETGFDSRPGQDIFLFFMASRSVLGPTQPLIQWILGTLSPAVKQQGYEAEVEVWSYTSTHSYVPMAWFLVV